MVSRTHLMPHTAIILSFMLIFLTLPAQAADDVPVAGASAPIPDCTAGYQTMRCHWRFKKDASMPDMPLQGESPLLLCPAQRLLVDGGRAYSRPATLREPRGLSIEQTLLNWSARQINWQIKVINHRVPGEHTWFMRTRLDIPTGSLTAWSSTHPALLTGNCVAQ